MKKATTVMFLTLVTCVGTWFLGASTQQILDCTLTGGFSWPSPPNAYDSEIRGIKLSSQNLQLTRTIFGTHASGEIVRGSDLVALTPEFPIPDVFKQSVAGPNGDFGVFFVTQTAGTNFLFLQHYDSNGTPIDSAQPAFQTMGSIDSVQAVLLSDLVNIALVVHEVSGAISGVIFNNWKVSVPAFSIGSGSSYKLTAALSSAKFVVTWIDPSSNLKFRIYRSNGTPLSGSPTVVTPLATSFGIAPLINTGGQFVIGWASTKDLTQTVTGGYVFGQVFSSSGVTTSSVFSIRTNPNQVVLINGVSTMVVPDSVSFVTFPNGLFIALYRVPRPPYPPGTAYLYARSYQPSGESLNTKERIVLPLTKDEYLATSLTSGGWMVVAQYFRRDPPISIGLVFKTFSSIYDLVGIESYPVPSSGSFAFKADLYRIPRTLIEVTGNSQQSSVVLIWDSASDAAAFSVVSGLQCVLRASQCYNDFQATTPEVIEPIQTLHDQRFPSVSTFQNTQVVVWQSDSLGNGKWDIISRFNNTSSEKKLNSIKAGYLANPSVAMSDQSSFFAVWQELNQDGSGWGIYGTPVFQYLDTQPEFRINDYTASNQINPFVSCSAYGGRCVVVWQSLNQDAATGYGVYGKEVVLSSFDITGISSEFRVNSLTLNNQQNPKVTVLPDGGRFVVTWEHMTDGDGWGVYYKVVDWFDLTNNIAALPGQDIRANQVVAGNQIHPSVAAIGTSNQFVIAWLTQHGTNDIVARIFDPTGPVSDEFFVTSVSGTQLGYLSVAPFYVGWAVSWLGTDGVFLKTFNGTTVKDSFQVNTAVVGTQPATPSLAGAPFSTSLIVSWESSQIDGSGYGVATRSFGCVQ